MEQGNRGLVSKKTQQDLELTEILFKFAVKFKY